MLLLICLISLSLLGTRSYRVFSLTRYQNLFVHKRYFSNLSVILASNSNDGVDDDIDSVRLPLDQFMIAFTDSLTNENLLKLILSEKEEKEVELVDPLHSIIDSKVGMDTEVVSSIEKEDETIKSKLSTSVVAISGRLLKVKSKIKSEQKRSQLQLIYYNDKTMKKCDYTKNYNIDNDNMKEIIQDIKDNVLSSFKKAVLSTRESDFELKMRKGIGKFKETSKVLS